MPEEHNILTLELIDRDFIKEEDIQIFYYDNLFEQLLQDGNSYKDLIKIIHYIVPRVIKRDFKDEDGRWHWFTGNFKDYVMYTSGKTFIYESKDNKLYFTPFNKQKLNVWG